MKRRSLLVFGLILISAFSALALMGGCGRAEKAAVANPVNRGVEVVPVETARIERQSLAITKSYTGTLEGEAQANIVAKISERITAINGSVGQSVQKGRTVIALDKSGTTSQYYQAEANYKNAEKNLERMKALLAEGAISQQLLDGTQTAFDIARANFEAARSAVELVSPISGVVTALNVNLGDLAQPGAVLATVADIHRMKVIFSINEADVMQLAAGQSVEIWSEGGPEGRAQGKIVQISRSADVRSRSFEIKALFPNTADQWYRPGMFCKVAVTISPRNNALVVPAAAILSDGLTSRVYKVVGGRAIPQPVRTGISDGARVEILEGVTEQETVVTTGATNLRDSSLVAVTPALQ